MQKKDILAVNFLQYSSFEERERDEVASRNQQRQRTPITKALHFYRLASEKKPDFRCPFIPTGNFRDELTVESGILMKNSKVSNSRNTEAEISDADTPRDIKVSKAYRNQS